MCDATIIIAAWNAEDTVERSIESAFNQAGVSVEVIVVDDASTDNTYDILVSRTDVVFDRLIENGGPAIARNRALDLARGRWIAVLDADDTMEPQRLAGMISKAKTTGADIVLGNFRKVDATGKPLEDEAFLPPPEADYKQVVTLENYVKRNQVKHDALSIGYLKPILSRDFLNRTQLRYDPTLRNGEDCHLIFAALAQDAKVIIDPTADYLYTVRRGSISHRANPQHLKALIAADHRFLHQYGTNMAPTTRRLFESREAGLTEMMVSEHVLERIKSGNILDACKLLVRSPKIVLRVARQIGEGLGKRLKARY